MYSGSKKISHVAPSSNSSSLTAPILELGSQPFLVTSPNLYGKRSCHPLLIRPHLAVVDYFRTSDSTLRLPPKFCLSYCLQMLLGKCSTSTPSSLRKQPTFGDATAVFPAK